jgi:hypothetical protein
MTQYVKRTTTFPNFPQFGKIVTKIPIIKQDIVLGIKARSLGCFSGVTPEVTVKGAFNSKHYFGIDLQSPIYLSVYSPWTDEDVEREVEINDEASLEFYLEPNNEIVLELRRAIEDILDVTEPEIWAFESVCSLENPSHLVAYKAYSMFNEKDKEATLSSLLILEPPTFQISRGYHLARIVNSNKYCITNVYNLRWFYQNIIETVRPLLTDEDVELARAQHNITTVSCVSEIFKLLVKETNGKSEVWKYTLKWVAPRPAVFA